MIVHKSGRATGYAEIIKLIRYQCLPFFYAALVARGSDMTNATKDLKTLFLSDKDLANRYSIHRVTPWRWVRDGKLPAPIKINGSTRWKLSDIEAWEASQEVSA